MKKIKIKIIWYFKKIKKKVNIIIKVLNEVWIKFELKKLNSNSTKILKIFV